MGTFKRLLLRKVDHLIDRAIILNGKAQNIMALLDALTAQVTANTTVIQSALTLINGFAAQLAAAGTDPAALAALQTALATSDTQLAAAVAANTPTPVTPPVTP